MKTYRYVKSAKLGLGLTGFNRDFLGLMYSSHIDEDIESGKSNGVKSTPSFFINEDRYDGAWDLDSHLLHLTKKVYSVGDK